MALFTISIQEQLASRAGYRGNLWKKSLKPTVCTYYCAWEDGFVETAHKMESELEQCLLWSFEIKSPPKYGHGGKFRDVPKNVQISQQWRYWMPLRFIVPEIPNLFKNIEKVPMFGNLTFTNVLKKISRKFAWKSFLH